MITVNPNLRAIVDHDGAVILNSSQNQITTLNSMGGYIWQQLEKGICQDDLVCSLALETGEDSHIIERDVQEFLSDLASRHLILNAHISGRESGAL